MQVTEIWRYPVKSLGGHRLDAAEITAEGIAGDRVWALVDETNDRVISAKRSRVWGGLLRCRAAVAADADPADPAALTITFPDGATGTGEDPATLVRLGDFGGRPVRLARATADPKIMEMEWAAETHAGMEEAIAVTSAQAVQDGAGADPVGAAPAGGAGSRYYDLAPLHLITTSSINRLEAPGPQLRTVLRRYRPNLVIGADDWDDGYVEDEWVGGPVMLGDLELAATTAVGRCVMVNLAHQDVPADPTTLRRIAAEHRIHAAYGRAAQPCLGVYADVIDAGVVRLGDPVRAPAST